VGIFLISAVKRRNFMLTFLLSFDIDGRGEDNIYDPVELGVLEGLKCSGSAGNGEGVLPVR
jgi:hypothetical protein